MKTWNIRTRLMVAVAFSVLLLVAINGFYNYQQARSSLLESVSDTVQRSGASTHRFVSTWLNSKAMIVESAAMAVVDAVDPVPVLTQGSNAGDFLYMYLGTSAGDMIMFPDETLPDDFDPRTRPWFKQAQGEKRQIITPPYVDASSGNLIMSFAQPVGQNVLAADVALTDIVQEVLGVELGASGYASIVDGNNNFLVHPDESKLASNLTRLIGNVRLTNDAQQVQINSENWLSAAYPIDGTEWRVVLMVKSSEAFSELGTLAISNTLVSVLTILIVTVVTGFIISYLLRPLAGLDAAMSDIAKGEADLTRRLTVVRNDEIGSLSQSFNQFVESVHQLVSESIEYSHQLESLSDSSHSNAKANNEAIQLQQSEISQVAAAINQMSSTSAEVAQNAGDTAEATQKASTEGKNGAANATENRARMGKLTDQIDTATGVIGKLDEQALQINTILSTIQDIAEQTNLLALNAAIEAARAGDQGRGFAVVADEVRALSQRTHQATGEIQTMIETLQDQTQQAVSIMNNSKTLTGETASGAQQVTLSLNAIGESIEDISARAQSIAEASREQNLATEEISRIATAIQDASNQLASNVNQATTQSDDLHNVSRKIRQNLSRFKV